VFLEALEVSLEGNLHIASLGAYANAGALNGAMLLLSAGCTCAHF
jgi:hypothetical protein